jgi:hypothetical protein
MILRRYIRQENWFAIILELVVIMLGLFLAFQLDRWYESQRSKSDLQAHLEALTEDFTENEARLITALSEGKQEMEAAITIRAEIRKDSPDLSVAELNQLISQTSLLPAFSAVDLAYRNLISGGTLSDFLSPDLKKDLAEFYAAYEITQLIQNTQELQYVTLWQPYALNNLDYAASNRKVRAGRDNPALRPYIDPDLILTAMKTKQFENIVVIQWETAEDLVNDWSQLLESVKRIQAMLSSPN